MAILIDASTPTVKTITGSSTSTASNSFSPPANSVIFCLVAVGNLTGNTQTVTSVTDSLGSHLTWTLMNGPTDGTGANQNARSNAQIGGGVTGATAEVWWASCPSSQTSMTVTPTWANSSLSGGGLLGIIVFTGAATSQVGAVGLANNTANTGTVTHAVATTANNSWVMGIQFQWNSGTGPTAGTAQSTSFNSNSFVISPNYWAQRQNATTTTSGTSVTINDTAPTSVSFNQVVFEVLPASGTLNTKSVTGGASFTGAIPKQTNKLLVA